MNFYGPKRQSLENPVRRTTRLVDEIQYGTQKDLPLQSLARSQPSKCYALVRFLRFASMTRRRTYRSQLSIRQKCLDLKVCRPWVPKKVTTDHRKVYRKYNLTCGYLSKSWFSDAFSTDQQDSSQKVLRTVEPTQKFLRRVISIFFLHFQVT